MHHGCWGEDVGILGKGDGNIILPTSPEALRAELDHTIEREISEPLQRLLEHDLALTDAQVYDARELARKFRKRLAKDEGAKSERGERLTPEEVHGEFTQILHPRLSYSTLMVDLLGGEIAISRR